MPPVSPAELLAIALLGASLVLVPSAVAFAVCSLARSDRRADLPSPARRHSPRRAAAGPRHRSGPHVRRF